MDRRIIFRTELLEMLEKSERELKNWIKVTEDWIESSKEQRKQMEARTILPITEYFAVLTT